MKFTKEEAIKALAGKLAPAVGNIDKWSRTISENVDTLWKIFGEESEVELETFVNSSIPLFNTTAGFIRKETSDLAKTYEAKIKEMEKSIPPSETTPPRTQPIGDEFIKRLEALEAENIRQKEIIKNKELSSKLVSKMKEKGIKNDKWIEAMIGNVVFNDSFNVDAEADKYLELYNSMLAVNNPQMTPQKPGGGADTYQNDTIKAAAAIAKQSHLIGS